MQRSLLSFFPSAAWLQAPPDALLCVSCALIQRCASTYRWKRNSAEKAVSTWQGTKKRGLTSSPFLVSLCLCLSSVFFKKRGIYSGSKAALLSACV